jgi:hypothetical protein
MFERVQLQNGQPIEFLHGGHRFRVHTIQSCWREAGGWWKHLDQGETGFIDNQKTIWHVEAAPLGALNVFEIQFDDVSKTWSIKPASKVR